jgi:phosphatidate cytidylyltransferase
MFAKRLLTVAILLPVFAAALLLLPRTLWALFLLPGLAIAAAEWIGLAGSVAPVRYAYAAAVALSALAILFLAEGSQLEWWLFGAAAVFWICVAPAWLFGHWSIRQPLVLGTIGWIALVPMWLALVHLQATPWILLLVLSIVWIADTAAYAAGRRWGRHKLAPLTSPGKSWEGVAGAALAVGVYYAVLWFVAPAAWDGWRGGFGALVFAGIFVLSIVGDLFESLMKRQAGVKDSGQLLPGHGGMLDRIDGLTSTVPLAAFALYYR